MSQNPDVEFLHSKFCATPDVFEGKFGKIEDYLLGLDHFIGMPNPRVAYAIEKEHLYSEDSHQTFAMNDLICTPAQEYEIVLRPKRTCRYPGQYSDHNPREIHELEEFLSHENFHRAKLLREEVIALRLYTGPMFCKYNAALRKFPVETFKGLHGNGYTTTIHAVVSGIIKLSQIMVLPASRKVYRGVSGMTLPTHFWESDACGCRGGVDYGILSTTLDMSIALEYCSKSPSSSKTLFEIEIGQVNRGADLSWLSQYPREAEILMPPLSNLEVVGGSFALKSLSVNDSLQASITSVADKDDVGTVKLRSDIVDDAIGNIQNKSGADFETIKNTVNKEWIIVVPMRLDINTKSRTLEELVATRKVLHIATFEHLLQEARSELRETFVTRDRESERHIRQALQPLESRLISDKAQSAEWFNDNMRYRAAQNAMLDAKEQAVQKARVISYARRVLMGYGVKYWEECRSSALEHMDSLSYEDRSLLKSYEDRSLLKEYTMKAQEARKGVTIMNREKAGLMNARNLLVHECAKLRESLSLDTLTSLALQEDDSALEILFSTAIFVSPEEGETLMSTGYMTGCNAAGDDQNSDCDTTGLFAASREVMCGRITDDDCAISDVGYWKKAAQRSQYDEVLQEAAVILPAMNEAVELLHLVGYFGENNAEDERYSRLLKAWVGKAVECTLRTGAEEGEEEDIMGGILDSQKSRIRTMEEIAAETDTTEHNDQHKPVTLGRSHQLCYVRALQQRAQSLLNEIERHEKESACKNTINTFQVGDGHVSLSSGPTFLSTSNGKLSVLRVIHAKVLWICQVYSFLRAQPDFPRLRTLERRLKWGRGGLGRGQTTCVQNAIIAPLEEAPVERFGSSGFVERVIAAVDLVADIASNSDIPWACEFDLSAVSLI